MTDQDKASTEIVPLLRELGIGQREIIDLLRQQNEFTREQRDLAAKQLEKSRAQVEESIGLQRNAMKRFRLITMIAVPGIVACIAAIAYLVVRYF